MTDLPSAGPPGDAAPMVIAYDGSPHAEQAIRAGAAVMAGRSAVVVTVWRSLQAAAASSRIALPDNIIAGGVAALDAEARGDALGLAEDGARLARSCGLRAEALEAQQHGSTAEAIAAVADAHDAGVIVVGSRGRSAVRSTILGSVTYGLLHATRRPTLVARAPSTTDPPTPKGPVMLCYDGSAPARHAAVVAGGLLRGARGVVVHCWEPVDDRMLQATVAHPTLASRLKELANEMNGADREQAETLAAEGAEVAATAGFEVSSLIVDERQGTWEALAAAAEDEDVRLVVVGSRGRSTLTSLVIGSVSHGLLHHCPRPLLVVPPPEARERRGGGSLN